MKVCTPRLVNGRSKRWKTVITLKEWNVVGAVQGFVEMAGQGSQFGPGRTQVSLQVSALGKRPIQTFCEPLKAEKPKLINAQVC